MIKSEEQPLTPLFSFFFHYTHFVTKLLESIVKLNLKKPWRQPLTPRGFFLSLHTFSYLIITIYYKTTLEKRLRTTLNATFFIFPSLDTLCYNIFTIYYITYFEKILTTTLNATSLFFLSLQTLCYKIITIYY